MDHFFHASQQENAKRAPKCRSASHPFTQLALDRQGSTLPLKGEPPREAKLLYAKATRLKDPYAERETDHFFDASAQKPL
jgi:hypothetical protein